MSQLTPPLSGRRILVTGGATGIGAAAVASPRRGGCGGRRDLSPDPAPGRPRGHLAAVRRARRRRGDGDGASRRPSISAGWTSWSTRRGCGKRAYPGCISADDISFLLDTNVKATILTNQAAHAIMKDQDPKGGRIINFGSSEAVMGSPISAVYAATKGRSGLDPIGRQSLGRRQRHRQRPGSGGADAGRRPAARFPRSGAPPP